MRLGKEGGSSRARGTPGCSTAEPGRAEGSWLHLKDLLPSLPKFRAGFVGSPLNLEAALPAQNHLEKSRAQPSCELKAERRPGGGSARGDVSPTHPIPATFQNCSQTVLIFLLSGKGAASRVAVMTTFAFSDAFSKKRGSEVKEQQKQNTSRDNLFHRDQAVRTHREPKVQIHPS